MNEVTQLATAVVQLMAVCNRLAEAVEIQQKQIIQLRADVDKANDPHTAYH